MGSLCQWCRKRLSSRWPADCWADSWASWRCLACCSRWLQAEPFGSSGLRGSVSKEKNECWLVIDSVRVFQVAADQESTYHNASADDVRQQQLLAEVLNVQVFAVILERADEAARIRSQTEDRIEVGLFWAELTAGRLATSGQLTIIVDVDRVEVVFLQIANSDVKVDRVVSLMRRKWVKGKKRRK